MLKIAISHILRCILSFEIFFHGPQQSRYVENKQPCCHGEKNHHNKTEMSE